MIRYTVYYTLYGIMNTEYIYTIFPWSGRFGSVRVGSGRFGSVRVGSVKTTHGNSWHEPGPSGGPLRGD